jgi:uncharacterized membrane protein YphA (DoxX/SURF4 family)
VASSVVALRWMLIVIFATAAWGKLRGRRAFGDFTASVADLRLVPAGAVGIAALLVPLLELLLVVRLAAGGGFAGSAVLLAAFTFVAALAGRRRSSVSCCCFGASGTPLGGRHAVRNASLTALAAGGWATAAIVPAPGGAEAVLAAVTGAVAGLLVTRSDDLWSLFDPPRSRITEN